MNKEFLHNILKEIMPLINADCGSLFLFDSHNQELILDSFYNSCDLHLKGLRQRVGEGVLGKVIDIHSPVLVKDIGIDARFRKNGFKHYRTNSFISIPLFTAKGLIGVINLADKANGEAFNERDFNFAVTIAKYACLTLDSSYEKQSLHEQKSVLEKYASVGKLAAGVVHEVNNPLDGIIRYANIMLEQMQDNTAGREYLLEIKKGLNRIANITRSLLEFSHQVNSNPRYVKKYVDIQELISESLDVLSNKISERILVKKFFPAQLPKILDLGLSHIITNLIKNSLDAISEGGVLEISTGLNDFGAQISIKDNGPGIPDEIKKRIFEPFFTTKSKEKGTGLGLAICNEIIKKYEGAIELKSASNEGSAFVVSIPKRHLKND